MLTSRHVTFFQFGVTQPDLILSCTNIWQAKRLRPSASIDYARLRLNEVLSIFLSKERHVEFYGAFPASRFGVII